MNKNLENIVIQPNAILCEIPEASFSKSGIMLSEKDKKDARYELALKWLKVLLVGEKVTWIKPGDEVIAAKMTHNYIQAEYFFIDEVEYCVIELHFIRACRSNKPATAKANQKKNATT